MHGSGARGAAAGCQRLGLRVRRLRRAQLPGPLLPEWSEAVRLAGERETLGLYLTGHPLARCESSLARFVSHRIGDLVSDRPVAGLESGRFGAGRPVTVAGLIDEVKKRGPRVILTLDDRQPRAARAARRRARARRAAGDLRAARGEPGPVILRRRPLS